MKLQQIFPNPPDQDKVIHAVYILAKFREVLQSTLSQPWFLFDQFRIDDVFGIVSINE